MTERKIRKLYVSTESLNDKGTRAVRVVLKDNNGRTVEDYREAVGKVGKTVADYQAVERALELSAKHCRERVYIFTDNRLLVNQFYGSFRVRKRETFKLLMEIKLLCGFFKCVRVFHVRREAKAR